MIVKRVTSSPAPEAARSRRPRRRQLGTAGALAALAATAALASGCNLQWSPYAAKVGTTVVTPSQLDTELREASGNASFLCLLERTGLAGTTAIKGAGTSTYDSSFVAYVLTNLVNGVIAHRLAVRYRLPESPAARALAREQVLGAFASELSSTQCGTSSQPILRQLGPELSGSFIQLQLDEDALAARAEHIPLTLAGLAAWERSHARATKQACLSGVFVKTRAEADRVRAALRRGEPLQAVIARYSPSQGASRGVLGCYTASELTSIEPAIEHAAAATSIGGAAAPVAYQGAWLVIVVTSRPFEPAVDALNSIFTATAPTFAKQIAAAVRAAHVEVNPQYGRWTTSKALAASGFGGKVVPNRVPSSAVLLNPSKLTASATAPAGLSGSGSG
ncbi:MAG TPA: hypothetical protein VKU92_00205 [Acidimicrobiales bacterium]|nr:hypothetical protein [Acidimicrobiales bacterium]